MKGIIPNGLTASNLLAGVVAITFTFEHYWSVVVFCIIWALVADFFDGFAARMLGVAGDLGKQLDSLADMVTFGVLPGLFMLEILQEQLPDDMQKLQWVALALPLGSLFRLAKFNISTNQSTGFIGLPTPAMTMFFLAYPIQEILETPYMSWMDSYETTLFLILFFAWLMVSPLPLLAMKFKDYSFANNWLKYLLIGLSIGILAVFRQNSLSLLIVNYVVLSIIGNMVIKGQKKTQA